MPLDFIFTHDSFIPDLNTEALTQKEESLREGFLSDRFAALFNIGFETAADKESMSLSFLRIVSERFLRALTVMPELELVRENADVILSEESCNELLEAVPFGIGTEYIDKNWLVGIFAKLNEVYSREISAYSGTVQMFLTEKGQKLRVPERIFFHLVENKEEDYPFAFMATYATTDDNGQVRHLPLSYALTEFRGDRERLITLLSCLNKVSEVSPLLGGFVESGEMFHPLKFSAEEAYTFLKSVPEIEECGVLCRVPDWWRKRYSSVSVNVVLGEKKQSMLGFDTLVSMVPELSVNDEALTKSDIELLLKQTEGLAQLKGKWVEVNHAELRELLEKMDKYGGELTFLQALRMQNGTDGKNELDVGVKISNGKWLNGLLKSLRHPAEIKPVKAPAGVKATLRPYQLTGFNWLLYMQKSGFGACLADDMGLGKTLQILTFLEKLRSGNKEAKVLIIVPASLLGNWEKETQRFTPKMSYTIMHGKDAALPEEGNVFLHITTYGMAARMDELKDTTWDCLILDEAQAIKNPATKQTRAIKKIPARHKIAMTGTPIENDLTNLWSLFDFLNKGLLGTSAEFKNFAKKLSTNRAGYQKLKGMVSPFILRRVKTDKNVIADLPDKLEQLEYVKLSKKQIVLYRRQVAELESALSAGQSVMKRRGLVLSTILKLKQICNHPDQFMGQETYDPSESGKFGMLREICETIYEKRERVLVFTQYKEITEHLAAYLERIFHSKGLVLHGGTPVKKRTQMVEKFNGEAYVPFMVLSVKAGGTGLNLTAANHVIHFDRWWNPAVENQATDRAFRIGQQKNVIVHKLVSEGTIEEKIDAIINSKKELAENVIGSGGENWITEMNDSELLKLMRLELK
ncbi:MAG: DEAD/DEAH box helicase [Ruminiclostridium sp.]|nr:DEAD/DEAH box helicase [Ruminiclostridium sp.]